VYELADGITNPIGHQILFGTQSDGTYATGRVAAFSKASDLGLVQVDPPYVTHPFARVAEGEIHDGDDVAIVGHPSHHGWSFARGYVSASRPAEKNADGEPMPTLQIGAAFSRGNSGGGAFDSSGRLIGVASYVEGNTNGMGFFVHRDAVRAFLRGAGAL
jgi:serine protease Do